MYTRPLFLFLVSLTASAATVLPISFEQRAPQSFAVRSAGFSAEFQADRVILPSVTLRFLHPSSIARLEGAGRATPATYIGPGTRRTYRQFSKLAVRDLYPGIDLIFHGTGGSLEYDLELAPQASPDLVRLSFDGARRLRLDAQGDLMVETATRVFKQKRPRAFQAGSTVPAYYILLPHRQVAFQLGSYDHTLPLTIDPVLVSVNYFGGSASDAATHVATDAQGNVYVAGHTNSVDFPSAGSQGARPIPPLIALSNAGQTITPIPVGTEVGVTAIGASPDGNVLYAATPGGIYYSPNAGATWRKTVPLPILVSPLFTATAIVNDISVDAIDPSRAYVATSRGMFATAANGLGWGPFDFGLAADSDGAVFAQSVTVSQADHTVLYATTGRPNFLFKSTNAAGTWQLLNPTYTGEPPVGFTPFSSIVAALVPGGSDLYAVNANGTLLKSTDAGVNWQKLAERLFGTRVLRVDPSNSSNIFVQDNFGVQVSHDGGLTFSTLLPPSVRGLDVSAFAWEPSSSTLYLSTFSAIYATTDQGATWKVAPQVVGSTIHSMVAVAGRVLVALESPQTPFLVKFDPSGTQLLYSTFFTGGLFNTITGLATDARGNAYLAGYTNSPAPSFTTNLSASTSSTAINGFIAKLSADGANLLYADLLSGSRGAFIQGLAVDSAGAAYVTGQTSSPDFPTTGNAAQPKLPTTTCTRPPDQFYILSPDSHNYAFVSKLTPDGSALAYSTFLTGSCGSVGTALAVSATGEVLAAGSTTSGDFPVSSNAYQPAFPGPLDKTSPASAFSVAYVARLSAAGDKVLAGTYIGGGYTSQAYAITLDSSGNIYVTGATWGIAAGATPGAYQTTVKYTCLESFGIGPPHPPSNGTDAFVLALDPALSTPRFLTYLGGACYDSGNTIARDSAGNIWIAGATSSADFPLSAPFQGINGGFVSELSPDGSRLLFSSMADAAGLAIAPAGAVFVAGQGSRSNNFTTTVSLAKIDPTTSPAITIEGIDHLNVVPSSALGGVAPGEYIRIRGRGLGPAKTVESQLDSIGRLPFSLANTRVLFDNFPAPLISVQDAAIYCFVPFAVSRVAQVTVESSGQRTNSVRIAIPAVSPQILAVLNPDGSPNSVDHPARPGSVLSLYLTGLGQTNPGALDGLINSTPLPIPVFSPTIVLQGQFVQPQFVAAAAGMIAGITQVNIAIPAGPYPSNIINVAVGVAGAPVYITP